MTLYLHAEQTAELARLGYDISGVFDADVEPDQVDEMLDAVAAAMPDDTAYQVAAAGPNSEYFALLRRVKVLASVERALRIYLHGEDHA